MCLLFCMVGVILCFLVLVASSGVLIVMVVDGVWVSEWAWTGALGGVNFFGATADDYTIANFSLSLYPAYD